MNWHLWVYQPTFVRVPTSSCGYVTLRGVRGESSGPVWGARAEPNPVYIFVGVRGPLACPFVRTEGSVLSGIYSVHFLAGSVTSVRFVSTECLHEVRVQFAIFSSYGESSQHILSTIVSATKWAHLFTDLQSGYGSVLPMPLGSSGVASSVFRPISIGTITEVIELPPFSVLQTTPGGHFNFYGTFTSAPPRDALPRTN